MAEPTRDHAPDVTLVKLDGLTVSDLLRETRKSVLPEFIRRDALAMWILDLDPLKGTEFPWWWHLNYPWFLMMRQRLRFYHMTLLHIGWQYEIARVGVANCITTREKKNLEKSAANLVSCARAAGKEVSYKMAYAALANVAAVAHGQHRRDLDDAERLWWMWRNEAAMVEPWVRQVKELSWHSPSVAMLLFPWLTWSVTLGTRLEEELRRSGWRFREAPSMMSLYAKEEPVALSAQAEELPSSAQTRSQEPEVA